MERSSREASTADCAKNETVTTWFRRNAVNAIHEERTVTGMETPLRREGQQTSRKPCRDVDRVLRYAGRFRLVFGLQLTSTVL